jgi:pimeloyl-ACP methyl ester carboxylesterase
MKPDRKTAARRAEHPTPIRKSRQPLPPLRELAVPLRHGRRLGVAEFGVPEGKVIFWFHGTPGARRQVPPKARAIAARTGLRIIGVERPGVGQSTRHLYASLAEWARDINELADRLGVERFGLVGLSGGGPYVLACAHGMPDRVVAGAVFGGVAPTRGRDAAAGGFVRVASILEPVAVRLARPLGALLSGGVRALHPLADSVFDGALRLFPEADRKVLGRPDMRAMFIDDLLRGSKIGLYSVVYDFILFSRPWGFSIRDIRVPIHFWQGDADPLVPFSHGAHQAALVPGAGLTLRPGESHLGGLDAAADAIEFILSHWGRTPANLHLVGGRPKVRRKRKRRVARSDRQLAAAS